MGLAMPWSAMSGATPWPGSYRPCRPEPRGRGASRRSVLGKRAEAEARPEEELDYAIRQIVSRASHAPSVAENPP